MTQNGFKTPVLISLIGLWLFLPALITAPTLVLRISIAFSVLGIDPFSLALALPAALDVLVIMSYRRRQRSPKTILGILLLGWAIQALSIAIVWTMATTLRLGALILLLWLPLGIIVPQALSSAAYALLHIVGKRLRAPFFHGNGFPAVGVLTLLASALLIANLPTPTDRTQAHVTQAQEDSSYDVSDIAFRSGEKQTQLGRLPRPLRIFRTPAGYVGISLSGERMPLPSLDAIGTEGIEQLFLDVFGDKAYFVRGGVGYAYDLATKTTSALPEPIQTALHERFSDTFGTAQGRRIIAAHGSSIALAEMHLAGTGDVAIYDVNSGKKTFQTVYLGYDLSRVVLFWIDGKNFRLFLNGRGAPSQHPVVKSGGVYQRIASTIGDTMAIYLDANGEPYHRLSDDEVMGGIGKVAFSFGNEWFFKDKTPLLEFQTRYPNEKYGASKFSIRNLYLLDDGRIAIEIEDRLIAIGLADKRSETITDQDRITRLLGTTKLLSADEENAHHFLGSCGIDAETEAFSKETGNVFVFCLK